MADTAFDIKSDSPVTSDLKFWSIVGHEALSRPSFYELTVLSKNQHILPKDILGKAFNVGAYFMNADNEGYERHFQGHAVRFVRGGQVGNRYFQYHISLRSWFWLLSRRTNSRIYQDKPVLEVADAVFEDSPIKRFKKTNTVNVTGKHKPRRYCVQHAESDYQFLSHLLEDEGVYYWFDGHDKAGTMYFSDSSDIAHAELPATNKLRYAKDGLGDGRFNEIVRWVSGDRLDTGHHAGADSNFKTIRKKIGAKINAADEHDLADFEMFESPAGYFNSEDAETSAKIRGDELAARRQRYWAVTGWPDVAAGRNFTFEGDPDGLCDGDYLIAGCTFVMSHPGYEGVSSKTPSVSIMKVLHEALNDDAINVQTLDTIKHIAETTPTLRTGLRGTSSFLLTLLPADQPYRPARLTPGVVMPGPQSAIVVGAAGKEIDVDEFGRVKVQFHWDRYGTNDDKSTAWVRVSQPMAGRGWGAYFTPRIGQEVIVDFLNGDPDRPIITGRVYNSDQPIPYKSGTQSGFKTRSSPDGTPANYNEIMFEDKKGAENINIHGEKNMSTSVKNDHSTSVDRDQSITVKRDQTNHVDRDRKSTVTRNDTNMVVVDQKNTVKGNQNNQVVGNRDSFVNANDALTVTGTQNTTVIGARTDVSKAGETRTVVGDQTVTVSGKLSYKAASMSFEAAHIDWMVTGASSKYITVPTGPLHLMANKIKLMSNTGIEMMAVGSIDNTSVGSNTTVLGPNTSGYIGNNSEANLGITQSTFMGMSIENSVSLAMSNFIGIAIQNSLGVTLTGGLAPEISSYPISVEQKALKTFTPGTGAGGAGGAAAAGILGAVFGAASAIKTVGDTLKQYADAATALENAANEAHIAQLPGLEGRLRALQRVALARRSQGKNIVVLGAASVIAGPVMGSPLLVAGAVAVGQSAINDAGAEALGNDQATNADGSAAAPPPPPGQAEPGEPWLPSGGT
jgi:type VI secretion system secreted protein VgrG